MLMRYIAVTLALIGFLGSDPGRADIQLPALIADHMVLQRDARVVLWGWADPGERVQIEFHGRVSEARTERNGHWSASVGPFSAGGPFDLVVTGLNRLVIRDVLIGDVWLVSGQSNMEYPMRGTGAFRGVDHGEQEIAAADYPQIRLFRVDHTIALTPQTHVDADPWTAATPESVASFSAVGYLFGRELQERYRVPIGLIESTWGGSVAESWVSAASLAAFPEFRESIAAAAKFAAETSEDPPTPADVPTDPNRPALLYNGMIAPLAAYRVKGILWYQGEANVDRASQYRALFPALIRDWRRHWGYELPFLFVQIAGYQENRADPAEYPRAELREAQSMALALPATGMATAVDLGDEAHIHPSNKRDVAHRLVLAAAKVAYGESLVASGPVFQSMTIEGTGIRIRFSDIGSGLSIKGDSADLSGFEIAGADGKFSWARARIDGDSVLVSSEPIREPVAVRYDWRNTPDGNLYNKEGLPAIPFRTDAPNAASGKR
jgi:sialate O-acetylesterase